MPMDPERGRAGQDQRLEVGREPGAGGIVGVPGRDATSMGRGVRDDDRRAGEGRPQHGGDVGAVQKVTFPGVERTERDDPIG